MNTKTLISIVGVPEDGCLGLTSRAVAVVSQARIIAGYPRHLTWFPQFTGTFIDMSQLGVSKSLQTLIDACEEGDAVVLASGDPLYFGIGALLVRKMPIQELAFYPSLTSPQLAFSRLGLPWQEAQTLSLHARSLAGLVAKLQYGDLFALLTDTINTPQQIARHLQLYSEDTWDIKVCEALASPDERISEWRLEQLAKTEYPFHQLNLLVLQRNKKRGWGGYGTYANDSDFAKRMPNTGLITKQPIRNLALTMLKLTPDACVWDIGSGSGSIAIEAAKQAYRGSVYAIESNPECFEHIQYNSHAHGTDNVSLIKGIAPHALDGLSPPDAVFIGGSRGEMHAILYSVWSALAEGGHVVCSAITLETVQQILNWCEENGIEANYQLINISQSKKIKHYHAYNAYNPIYLFDLKKN